MMDFLNPAAVSMTIFGRSDLKMEVAPPHVLSFGSDKMGSCKTRFRAIRDSVNAKTSILGPSRGSGRVPGRDSGELNMVF